MCGGLCILYSSSPFVTKDIAPFALFNFFYFIHKSTFHVCISALCYAMALSAFLLISNKKFHYFFVIFFLEQTHRSLDWLQYSFGEHLCYGRRWSPVKQPALPNCPSSVLRYSWGMEYCLI